MVKNELIVSVIVPLYKGRGYVSKIVSLVDENARLISGVKVELILYNDYPDEVINTPQVSISDNMSIVVINSSVNSGIHAARVAGLRASRGDLILFLDQDDLIKPHYLKSQIESLGEGDVVVCKAVHDGKEHYSDTYRFNRVVTADFLLNNWNSIVSPGQVLIRRSAIPSTWTDRILKTNGADDYYLWLLLVGMKTEFEHNEEVLFEHTVKGDNCSLDTNRMMDSEEEMIDNLLDSGVFSEEEKVRLIELRRSLRRIHVKDLEDYREAYYCYRFLDKTDQGECKQKRIGIYGAGVIGRALGSVLAHDEHLHVVYIDRNADGIIINGMVLTPDNAPDDLDFIIVTPLPHRDEIVRSLAGRYKCPIYPLNEFIEKWRMK